MSAILSRCGLYRYRLDRTLKAGDPNKAMAFIMVNPSTADAEADDPTIRKCMGFAQRLDHGHLIVGNKFAWRAADVNDLRTATDPKGPENDYYMDRIFLEATTVVVGWGTLSKLPPTLRKRWTTVEMLSRRLGVALHCIGTGQDGHPRHPLMTAYATPLTEWRRP